MSGSYCVQVMVHSHACSASRGSSGRLGGGGGGGGRKAVWHFIHSFNCFSTSSHYIVGLITGGLELVWISGVISVVEETTQWSHLETLTHKLPLLTWRAPVIDL